MIKQKYPNALTLQDMDGTNLQCFDGTRIPARKISYPTLIERFKLAFDVFIGQADAFYWPKKKKNKQKGGKY